LGLVAIYGKLRTGTRAETDFLAVAASMRRPAPVTPDKNLSGDSQGGGALLWGSRVFLRRGGNPPAPASPLGGNGKGDLTFFAAAGPFSCSHRRFALLPFALFSGASAPVPVGVLNLNGCCHLCIELVSLVSEASVPPRLRSHPNPAIGLTQHNHIFQAAFATALLFLSGSYTSPLTRR
jgi:hypothetical protein